MVELIREWILEIVKQAVREEMAVRYLQPEAGVATAVPVVPEVKRHVPRYAESFEDLQEAALEEEKKYWDRVIG